MDKIASFTVKKRVAIQLIFMKRRATLGLYNCAQITESAREGGEQFYLQHPSGNITSQTLLETFSVEEFFLFRCEYRLIFL